jgi:uncharacterized spore protein YtfJ
MTSTDSVDVQQLIESARDALTVRRVFGDPIDQNGIRIIPAARIRGGGGGGGGSAPDGQGSGSGAGFGVMANPAGAFVVTDRDVTWRPAVNPERIAMAAFTFAGFALWTLRSILRRRVGRAGQ